MMSWNANRGSLRNVNGLEMDGSSRAVFDMW